MAYSVICECYKTSVVEGQTSQERERTFDTFEEAKADAIGWLSDHIKRCQSRLEVLKGANSVRDL